MRLLLLTFLLYVVLLPLWWYSLEWLSFASSIVADLIYGFFDPRVSISSEARLVRVVVTGPTGLEAQTNSTALRLDTVTYGLPMFAALVIATRADSLFAKARVLFTGTAVMTVLTVAAVMAWAKLTSLGLDERLTQGGEDRSSFLYYTFHGYAFSQPVVAVGLWLGMLMLGMFKRKEKPLVPALAVGRNAPCPCGSGRKYKKCCGAGERK